jgi:hypothetical protein
MGRRYGLAIDTIGSLEFRCDWIRRVIWVGGLW